MINNNNNNIIIIIIIIIIIMIIIIIIINLFSIDVEIVTVPINQLKVNFKI